MSAPHLFAGFGTGCLVGVLAAAAVVATNDDADVSVECAAAHVAAEVSREEFGTSTHGIPNRHTDEMRDELFQEAYEYVEEACGTLSEPRDLWLRYDDLINERKFRAWTEGENPEWLPWYRGVICPTLNEQIPLCTPEDN